MAVEARDLPAVARLVVAGKSTKVRQAAAHAIEDPEVLRQLIRDVRGGNDKGVYKVLTARRDLLIEQTRKLEQLRADIEAASADLERHSQGSYNASYTSTLDQFETRWEALASQADPDARSRAQQWIERSRQTIAEHLREVAAQASRELAVAEKTAAAERLRQQQEQEFAAAAAEQQRVLEEQNRAMAEEQQAAQKAEQQALRQIGGLIRKARDALSDGSSARAVFVRRAIDEKLVSAPPLPANLVSQMQQLEKQIAELEDWKSFSVTPKRAELIGEMESLVGAALDPLTLADRIKRLRDQWRALGTSGDENLETDRQRFQEVVRKAYQPCREYFAAQAVVRGENLRSRDALIAKLTTFEAGHDWMQPDWRAVIGMLRETRQEWRRCSPVDRQAGRNQEESFTAVNARLQDRLDAEYARNVKEKELLIERARQLLASDDGRRAIDAAKGLQQKWRTVGPVPREADQRLWSEFRKHSDAVFQKRDQDFASYTAGLEANRMQAVAMCEQLERMAAADAPELLDHPGALAELRRAFDALGEFPRADTQELRSRFDRGMDRCEESIARHVARNEERAWNDLFEAANHVRAYKFAVARGLATEEVGALKAAADASIASVQRWPRGGLGAIKQRSAGDKPEDFATNETALHMLCIRAEILTDTPTPTEDQTLRRDYQLQRLVQRMSQGAKADDTHLDALTIEWVGVGPVADAVYQPLLQRFRRCRERGSAGIP